MKKLISVMSSAEQEQAKRWIAKTLDDIGTQTIHTMVAASKAVRDNAYPPYSNYHVGAAILCRSGALYAGCNTEVVSWSQTSHAEQNAVTNAICDGEVKRSGRKFITAVAVVHKGTSAPCGQCRQIIAEHCDNALVVLANE